MRRLVKEELTRANEKFQSTHPMRDATFIPLSRKRAIKISIHASHAGCDADIISTAAPIIIFQSTHPMRDATNVDDAELIFNDISIHASHAGCDKKDS